ncbi:glycosyltransferase family 9 protein [Cytophaga aurantiaca]|uniref:glycosyltransferase family 9 protein n=1 Tax=Cytophaga aurantiaca TaxID=29530 RepID=UPI0003727ACE|nr:glycosyltransferase family 9 protein [Cytophaga aurantiaca]
MQKAQVNLNKILVIQTAFIGDAILATALLESIHNSLPEARIDLLVRKGNESLFQQHPFLNQVLIWDKKQSKYKNLFALLKTIRASKYDLVINLQRFGATGLLTALSGGGITVGYNKNPFSFLFTKKVPHELDKGLHEVDRNNQLVAWFASTLKRQPKLYPTKEHYARVEVYTQKSFICAAPNSVWFTKQYPAHKWIDFLNQVPLEYTVYLLGAPGDAESCSWIKSQVVTNLRIEILAGKLSFLESAALMEKAAMNYVNDSAPMHIASSMNAPVAAIFCSTVPAFGFGPLSDTSFNIETTEKLGCRPCGLHGYKACPEGHFKCAEGIGKEQLVDVLSNRF